MSELDNDLYQLILWEELLVSLIDRVEIRHDSVELADLIEHQGLLRVRRLEVIEAYHKSLIEILTTCDEVTTFIGKITMLEDEIGRRQSRCDVFEKTHFDNIVWFDYQGFSDQLRQNVRNKICRELEISQQVLKFLPS